MTPLEHDEVKTLLAHASGSVSYQSQYARTTATIEDGRVRRFSFASDYLNGLLDAERLATPKPQAPTVAPGPKSAPYTGSFPRGKHSHRCKGCQERNGQGAVACYKAKCTKPQLVATCEWCRSAYQH